jgi:hypothetical protein
MAGNRFWSLSLLCITESTEQSGLARLSTCSARHLAATSRQADLNGSTVFYPFTYQVLELCKTTTFLLRSWNFFPWIIKFKCGYAVILACDSE